MVLKVSTVGVETDGEERDVVVVVRIVLFVFELDYV